MKSIHRFMLMAIAAICMGMLPARADTSVISNGEGGWTKLTSLPATLSDYYFVFVDNSQDLMLELRKGVENPNNALFYMTSKNPLLYRSFLWTLEANSGTYAGMYSMRNVEYSTLMMQTEWGKGYNWDTNDQASPCEWTAVNMQYDSSNGYWTFENGRYPSSSTENYKGYLGPWKETNVNTNLVSGQELAANKSGDYIGHFLIYAILKTDAASYYSSLIADASTDNPVDVSYYINNREADLNSLNCWTTTGTIGRNDGSATYDGNAGFFEPSNWSSTFTTTMSQTVTSLPAGRYQVASVAQASTDCTMTLSATSGNNSSSATLNSKGASGSSISSNGGWEWLNSGTVMVETGSLTINVTATASAEHNWANADGFRLYYLGPLAANDLSAGDDCTALFITNPGFEENGAAVDVSADNLNAVTGWTLATVTHTSDVGTRAYSAATYAALNGAGDYCFNCYWEGKPLTQEIGPLPAGTYELSALVTTGNASELGTVYLNAGDAHSTGYARKSANVNYYHREKLVFTLTSEQKVTVGIRGGSASTDQATKGEWNEDGYWWYKCDDFRLTYLGEATQDNLYSQLQTLVDNCAPWTTGDEYATRYNTYSGYAATNTVAELTTAIDYLNNEYPKYALAYASGDHPYNLECVANPSYDNGTTSWADTHNNTGTFDQGVDSDGSQTNFFKVSTNTYLRHATIYQEDIVLDEGIYRLSARMKGSPKDNESTYIYATTGSVNHWSDPVFAGTTYYGYLTTDVAPSWSTVNAYVTLDAPAKLRVGALSWGNNYSGGTGGAFAVDDWKIELINNAIVLEGGVATAYGAVSLSAVNDALSADVAAIDLTGASGLSSAAISIANNPNLLIIANSGQVSNDKNVVVSGTCDNLELTDGHPFVNPTTFTATTAKYTLGNSYLAGGQFATLTLPFRATTLAGTAYAIADADVMSDVLKGTAVTAIEANQPVLVKAAGEYKGSSVSVPVVASGMTCGNGQLVGVYTATTAPVGSYVLQKHGDDAPAFYLVGSDTRPSVGPFRAYIKAQTNGARQLRVVFGDETDGISQTVNGASVNSQCYDLQGRPTSDGHRGITLRRNVDGSVKKVMK